MTNLESVAILGYPSIVLHHYSCSSGIVDNEKTALYVVGSQTATTNDGPLF